MTSQTSAPFGDGQNRRPIQFTVRTFFVATLLVSLGLAAAKTLEGWPLAVVVAFLVWVGSAGVAFLLRATGPLVAFGVGPIVLTIVWCLLIAAGWHEQRIVSANSLAVSAFAWGVVLGIIVALTKGGRRLRLSSSRHGESHIRIAPNGVAVVAGRGKKTDPGGLEPRDRASPDGAIGNENSALVDAQRREEIPSLGLRMAVARMAVSPVLVLLAVLPAKQLLAAGTLLVHLLDLPLAPVYLQLGAFPLPVGPGNPALVFAAMCVSALSGGLLYFGIGWTIQRVASLGR